MPSGTWLVEYGYYHFVSCHGLINLSEPSREEKKKKKILALANSVNLGKYLLKLAQQSLCRLMRKWLIVREAVSPFPPLPSGSGT